MGPRQIIPASRNPPTMPCPRGGGCRAISLSQINYYIAMLYISKNEGGVPNCWPNKIETVSAPFRSTGICSEIRSGDVPGEFEVPGWDLVSQRKVHDALIMLSGWRTRLIRPNA